MRLYIGSRDYRPAGFLTVDIDPGHAPDIVADVTDLGCIQDGSVDEVCASHVLEHLPWPVAFRALAEWARVLRTGGLLRVAVPDLAALASLIAKGGSPWGAAGLIYGVGRLRNKLEAHQYGYTSAMLREILAALGFGSFGWWNHDEHDASNGWIALEGNARMGISLNIAARKQTEPVAPPSEIFDALAAEPLASFDAIVARHLAAASAPPPPAADADPMLVQRIHFALVEARMRILHLEQEIQAMQEKPQGSGCVSNTPAK